MAYKFDENKYNKTFDSMYGSGSYDSGLSDAYETGKKKFQASVAKQQYLAALKEAQKKQQEEAEKKKYNGLTKKEYDKAQEKAHKQGRGGYLPSRDQMLKEDKANSKEEGLSPYTDTPSSYDFNKLTPYAKQKLGFEESWDKPKKDEKKAPAKKKKDGFWDDLKAAGKATGEFFNPFDDVSGKEAVDKYINRKQSDTFKEVARGANRAVDSASFGIMSNLDKKVNNRDQYYNSEREMGKGGGTDMITSGLGYLVPGAGAVKAVKGTALGAKAGTTGLAKLAQLAKEGAAVGGGLSAAEVGVREALNGKDTDWKDNAKHIGLGIGTGLVADPALYGAGKAIGKGFEKASSSAVKKLIPDEKKFADAVSSVISKDDKIVPKKFNLPEGETTLKNRAEQALNETEAKIETVAPIANDYKKEFEDAVKNQIEYLKSSMGKGVEGGTTSNGLPGNFNEVTGTFSVSKNPQWYRDFYAQNGRKPNQKELEELAVKHVLEGFQDETGSIPAWQPKRVQEIDDEIQKVADMLAEQPEQETVVKPILDALEEEKAMILNESQKAVSDHESLSNTAERIRQTLNPNKVEGNLDALKNPEAAATKAYEAISPGEVDDGELAKVAKQLLDEDLQKSGSYETFSEKIDRDAPKEKGGFWRNLRNQFIDDGAHVESLEKNVTGGVASAENSIYKQFRLFKGSAEKAHQIVKEQLYPLIKLLDDNKIDYKQLEDYALAVHARDVNEKGINSGFTNAEIEDTIKQLGTPEMEAARKQLLGINNFVLDMLKDGEVLSADQVAAMREKWPNYVSLFRSFDDDKIDFASGVSKTLSVGSAPIHTLKGVGDKELKTIGPMESLVKNIFKATNTVDRNKVAGQLGRLAELDKEGQFVRRLEPGEDAGRLNVISAMENGKKVQYEVPPEVYTALKNLDKESTNTLIKILQKPASLLRAGATLTPEFSLRNPLRDVPNAFVVSESGFNPLTDFPVGLWQAIWKGRSIKIGNREFKTSGELYKQFVKENGGYGNIVSMDRKLHQETLQKALTDVHSHYVDVLDPKTFTSLIGRFKNPIKGIGDTLRTIADISETATKVGEYRAALRSGATPQEAAYRARDIMDFGRAGVSVREANKVVAFLNANIQGKSKLYRAFKANPAKFIGKAAVSVTLPTIAALVAQETLANDRQRELIDDAPRWLKDTFYLVPIPGTNQIARIPKPFDLAFAFSNTLERAFEFAKKHDPEAFDGFLKEGLSQASIPVMLTGLAPLVEGMANYSFFRQGPIIPDREKGINYPDQYDVNTSQLARLAGKGINKLTQGEGPFRNFGSPRVIDNTIQGFTGGVGTYATSAIDLFIPDNGPERPAKSIDQEPLTRAFLVNQSSSGESLDKLYRMKDRLTKARGSAKQNQTPFPQEGQYKAVNQFTKNVGEITKQIRTIENSPNMSPEEKKTNIDRLVKQRNEIAKQAMDYMKKVK